MFIEYRSGRGIVVDWINDDWANPAGPAAESIEPPGLFEFIGRRVRLFTLDAFPLAAPIELVTSHALHGHTAENVVLTTGGALVVADALHGHTVDGVALSVIAVLALADTLHGHTAENVTLTTGGVLVVADALHGHTADGVALSVTAALAVADALHGHSAENATLTTGDVLAVADALHGHTADGVTLSVIAVLVAADAIHGHSAENITLTTGDVFVIADALHGHTADGVVLTLGDIALVIADALHAHRADNIRFGGRLTTIAEIVPYLLNGLVDGRVWESATPDDLPRLDGRILPFVVWTLHGGADAEYVEQFPAPSHSNARIQVHVAAPGGIVAERLMKDVRDALLASEYTVGVYGSPVGTYDPARKLKGRRQQFSVWFQQ